MPTRLVELLGEFDVDTALQCLTIIGHITLASEEWCTFLCVQTPLIGLLPQIMVHGDTELRGLTMWLISNICCNGHTEVEAVVSSGLVSNITMALRDNT